MAIGIAIRGAAASSTTSIMQAFIDAPDNQGLTVASSTANSTSASATFTDGSSLSALYTGGVMSATLTLRSKLTSNAAMINAWKTLPPWTGTIAVDIQPDSEVLALFGESSLSSVTPDTGSWFETDGSTATAVVVKLSDLCAAGTLTAGLWTVKFDTVSKTITGVASNATNVLIGVSAGCSPGVTTVTVTYTPSGAAGLLLDAYGRQVAAFTDHPIDLGAPTIAVMDNGVHGVIPGLVPAADMSAVPAFAPLTQAGWDTNLDLFTAIVTYVAGEIATIATQVGQILEGVSSFQPVLNLSEGTGNGTPSSGQGYLWLKASDKKLYFTDSTGTTTALW